MCLGNLHRIIVTFGTWKPSPTPRRLMSLSHSRFLLFFADPKAIKKLPLSIRVNKPAVQSHKNIIYYSK